MEEIKSLVYSGMMPRLLCCAPKLCIADDGDILVLYQAGGPTEPHPDNRVYLSRSSDGGATWSAPSQPFDLPGRAMYPSCFINAGGRITAYLMTHEGGFLDILTYYSESFDGGHTWTALTPIPLEKGTIEKYQDFGDIRLFTVSHIGITEEERALLRGGSGKIYTSTTAVCKAGLHISYDGGKSWQTRMNLTLPQEYKVALKSNPDFNFAWFEQDVARLSDGTIVMLCRVDRTSRLYRADSKDDGVTWSPLLPTDIPNPAANIRLFTLKDGRIALLHNPTEWRGAGIPGRGPLELWISDDDMKTWGVKKPVDDFPGGYSYPDGVVDEENGVLHLSFDYNRHDVIYARMNID